MEDTQLVTIVEGVNEGLKERLMFCTALLPEDIERREDRYKFRCVHYAVPRKDAPRYIAQYVKENPRPGWKEFLGEELI